MQPISTGASLDGAFRGLLGFAWVVGGRDESIPEPECLRRRLLLQMRPAVGRSCLFFCPVLLVKSGPGLLAVCHRAAGGAVPAPWPQGLRRRRCPAPRRRR
jgi:hypothetical protein